MKNVWFGFGVSYMVSLPIYANLLCFNYKVQGSPRKAITVTAQSSGINNITLNGTKITTNNLNNNKVVKETLNGNNIYD